MRIFGLPWPVLRIVGASMTDPMQPDTAQILAALAQVEQAACRPIPLGSAMARAMMQEFTAAVVAVVAEKRAGFLSEFKSAERLAATVAEMEKRKP